MKPISFNRHTFHIPTLLLHIALDLVGMLSFTVPGIGEFSDVIWAPLSAYLLMKMYPGTIGKVAGTIEFLEEILPAITDWIPTFTLTYLYSVWEHRRLPGNTNSSKS